MASGMAGFRGIQNNASSVCLSVSPLHFQVPYGGMMPTIASALISSQFQGIFSVLPAFSGKVYL